MRPLEKLLLGLVASWCLSGCAGTHAAPERTPVVDPPIHMQATVSTPATAGPGDSMSRSMPEDAPERLGGFAIGGLGYAPIDPHFRLEGFDRSWDTAERFELRLAYHANRDAQVQGVTAIYGYYENKDWDSGNQEISAESIGGGLELGALLYPFSHGPMPVDFAFYPYIRVGLGSSDGDFTAIQIETPESSTQYSGDLGDKRAEAGAGLDLHLLFGEFLSIGAGVGVNYWRSFGAEARVTGTTTPRTDIDFEGHDAFARFAVELIF